jgi:hypothetical protein
MVDPNREPADGKLSILSLKRWGYLDLTFLLSCIALSQEEVDRFVGRLIDKDPPTAWPANLPLPYSRKNPPPSVRTTVILIILQPAISISLWLVIQDLYPAHKIDVELSDEDNIGQKEPAGNDAEGGGAPFVETLVPNQIRSSLAEMPHPSTIDDTTFTGPSSGGQKKKCVALGTKPKPDKVPANQVIIEIPPCRGPQSPLDLVAVEDIFRCLFEAFQHVSQAVRTGTSAGDDAQPSKRARAPPLKKMIVPK